jgi:hypothetical protein
VQVPPPPPPPSFVWRACDPCAWGAQFAKRTAISAEVSPVQRPSIVAPVNAIRDKPPPIRKLIFDAVKGNLLFEGLTDG